jgi:crotonobetainyl-CoA:carnitine CoA-transferase CaiB-like acyl-CoA transferase
MQSQEELNRFIRDQRADDNTRGLFLRDIRVIDMATLIAAPFAATLLGDYGAEVIKVENPGAPDALRRWGVLEDGSQAFWAVFARNKFPVTINLKSKEGAGILNELIQNSDVLVDNMRPGTLERLGFEMDKLLKLNPGLIIGRMSGYGLTGPYSLKPGFGTLAEGLSGFTYLNAQPGGVPTNPPLALADFIAGIHLALAIMICLRGQERGERGGQVIDISLYEPLFGLFGPEFLTCYLTGEVPQPTGNELSYVAPRNNYKTKDDKWVALSGSAQKPFERLMDAIGRPDMKEDDRYRTNEERVKEENRRVLNKVISDWIGVRTLEEVISICDRLGVTVGPVASMEDIERDHHCRERGSWITLEDPVTGTSLRMPDVPFRLSETPGLIRFPGLPVGAANEVIFGDLVGYTPGQIRALRESGAI